MTNFYKHHIATKWGKTRFRQACGRCRKGPFLCL